MAAEYIDGPLEGAGIYPTLIPGYEDAADIQEALRLYHYGSPVIPTVDQLGTANGINTKSVAGHLKALSNRITTEVTDRTNADLELQTQINTLSSTLGLQTTIATKTSSFILGLSDAGKTILLNTSSPMTLTVPTNSSVAIPVGYQYFVIEAGSGRTTFTPASGVTINSKNSQMYIDTQFGKATLVKVATDSWIVYGDIYENVAAPVTPVAPPVTPVAPPVTPVAPPVTPVAPPPSFPPVTPVAPVAPPVTPVAPVAPVAPPVTPVAPPTLPSIQSFAAQCANPDTGTCVGTVQGQTQAIWTTFSYSNASSYQITMTPGSSYTSNANADNDAYLGVFPCGQSYSLTLTVYALDNQQGESASSTINYTVSGGNCTATPVAPVAPPVTPVAPVAPPVTPVAPVAGTLYYACCTNGLGVSGTFSTSNDAVLGLGELCSADEPFNSVSGGVFTSPQSCNTPVTPVAPVAPVASSTTYYGCCTDGAGVSGSYSSSSIASQALNELCGADEPFVTLSGGVYTSPQSCNAPVTPVAPPVTPVAPPVTPVAPVAPPVTPVAPPVTPVAPVAPPVTPVAPPVTPVAPSRYYSSFCTVDGPQTWQNLSSCAANQQEAQANFGAITNFVCQFGTSYPPAPNCTPAPVAPVAPPVTPVAPPVTPVAPPVTPVAPPVAPPPSFPPVAPPVTPVAPPVTPVAPPVTPVAPPAAPVASNACTVCPEYPSATNAGCVACTNCVNNGGYWTGTTCAT
jgi:hypothetical protein